MLRGIGDQGKSTDYHPLDQIAFGTANGLPLRCNYAKLVAPEWPRLGLLRIITFRCRALPRAPNGLGLSWFCAQYNPSLVRRRAPKPLRINAGRLPIVRLTCVLLLRETVGPARSMTASSLRPMRRAKTSTPHFDVELPTIGVFH
jgi:hypothetical protein